jgi:hypothetical protein
MSKEGLTGSTLLGAFLSVFGAPLLAQQGALLPFRSPECAMWADDAAAAARTEDWSALEAIETRRLRRCELQGYLRSNVLSSLS